MTVVAWLLGSATGDGAAELHAGRLRMLCEKLVDTPVRGLLYEGAGTLGEEVLAGGAEVVRRAAVTWNIPVEVLTTDPPSRAGPPTRPPRSPGCWHEPGGPLRDHASRGPLRQPALAAAIDAAIAALPLAGGTRVRGRDTLGFALLTLRR